MERQVWRAYNWKMQYIHQYDETDCGAACLAMIASHYKSSWTITSIREIAGTDRMGTNLAGMVAAARSMGFSAHALKGTAEALSASLPVPFIAHLNVRHGKQNLLHYVVVRRITSSQVEVWNPDKSQGKKWLSLDSFVSQWTGYALFMVPEQDVKLESGNDSLWPQFLSLLRHHKNILVMACLSSLVLVIFSIVSTLYTRYLIDEVIFSRATFTLGALSVGMIALVTLRVAMTAVRRHLLLHFAYRLNMSLVFSYFFHIFRLPLRFFDSRKTGEILSRMQDIGKIQDTLAQGVVSVVMDVLMIVVVGPVLFATNRTLFLVVLMIVPLSSLAMYLCARLYKKRYHQLMEDAANLQSCFVESVNGAATVKALRAEQAIMGNFENHQMKVIHSGWSTARIQVWQELLTELLKELSTVITFWLGSNLVIHGDMSIGTLVSFSALAGYFISPLERLANLQPQIQEAQVATNRLGEILLLATEDRERLHRLLDKRLEGDIEFSGVRFHYGNRGYVYHNLTLAIRAGQTVAFVGPSGCGKTTLARLLLKLYEPEAGSIAIGGRNLQDMDRSLLRSRIGYVPQDIAIFSGSIAQNIALSSPESTLDEIILAAKRAGADSFIEDLPERYETQLGEQGMNLSGGQRQRLALARALLSTPDILILDEATSNLDAMAERIIQNTIETFKEQSITTIIIAHRLSTVIHCDKIFVLEGGLVVQEGNHHQLVQEEGLYRTMWEASH